ncbi:MAG: ATP-binding protein [Chloroflexota bacterium]
MFNRARWRLTIWFAGVFAIIILIIGGAVYVSARQSILGQVRDDLHGQITAVVGRGSNSNIGAEDILAVVRASGSFWIETDANGNILDSSQGVEPSQWKVPEFSKVTDEVTRNQTGYFSASTETGERVRFVVTRTALRTTTFGAGGQQTTVTPIYLEIGRSIEPQLSSLRRLVIILLGGGAIGLALAAAGGYWLAGRALKPIRATMEQQRAFVADASHELRTPLSLIRANAEMMQRHSDAPADPLFVEDIIKETDRLAYLVTQLLTLARSDSADAPMEKTPVDLNQLTTDMSRQMKMLAGEKQIDVNVQTNGAAIVLGDEQRLGELLLILLDNSIKYTDAGGKVNVAVDRENARVQVSVADTGVGIPRESLPHVFDRFYRVDKARSREYGGSGLGLAIARWIADKHDGRISIDSEPGKGTKVTVDLPAAAPA